MRRKPNNADHFFIESHTQMSAEDISQEINLDVNVVRQIQATVKKNPVLKSTQVKGHDGITVLSNAVADLPAGRSNKPDDSHYIYRPNK